MEVFGIMCDRIRPHSTVVRRLCVHARATGFSRIALFTPSAVDPLRKRIRGYVYTHRRWRHATFPFPSIVHDIGQYTDKKTIARVKRIKYNSSLRFTGYGIGNKAEVEQALKQHPLISQYLIPGILLDNPNDALDETLVFLHECGRVMVKPLNGSKGKGIKRVSKEAEKVIIEENGKKPFVCTCDELKMIWRRWQRENRYIVQKWIDINWMNERHDSGSPSDIRVVVHKNGSGTWQLGGMGIRLGAEGNVTSNVYCGGAILPFIPSLCTYFDEKQAFDLAARCEKLSLTVARHLETVRKRRLVELGIDLGVDKDGRLWLIEVNVKPGRKTIRRLYGWKRFDETIKAQVEYARYLLHSDRCAQG